MNADFPKDSPGVLHEAARQSRREKTGLADCLLHVLICPRPQRSSAVKVSRAWRHIKPADRKALRLALERQLFAYRKKTMSWNAYVNSFGEWRETPQRKFTAWAARWRRKVRRRVPLLRFFALQLRKIPDQQERRAILSEVMDAVDPQVITKLLAMGWIVLTRSENLKLEDPETLTVIEKSTGTKVYPVN